MSYFFLGIVTSSYLAIIYIFILVYAYYTELAKSIFLKNELNESLWNVPNMGEWLLWGYL